VGHFGYPPGTGDLPYSVVMVKSNPRNKMISD